MAEDFLEKIYKESKHLSELRIMLEEIRLSSVGVPVRTINEMLSDLYALCVEYQDINYKKAYGLFSAIEALKESTYDYICLADCIEMQVIPSYQALIQELGEIDVDDGEDIKLFSSQSGFLTMQRMDTKRFYHSMVDPMYEAFLEAKTIFDPQQTDYCILGVGLGYLAYQLYTYSEGTARIHIFELNEKIIKYGRQYGVLDWIPEENLEIFVSEDILPFLESVEKYGGGFSVHEIILSLISEDQKDALTNVMVGKHYERSFMRNALINIHYNIKNICKTINDLDRSKIREDVVLVAGGPSVDDRLEYIKEMSGEKTIIAVGTVFSKLKKNNITPDLVVFIDPQRSLVGQIEGLYDEKVPLIIFDCACKGLAEKYGEEKYLVLSALDKYLIEKENFDRNIKDIPMLNTGSTVTVAAASVALYLGAKSVELIGVDFGYPGNVTHAKGTKEYKKIDVDDYLQTACVKGGTVATDGIMNIYRHQMENIIENNPQVTFYNLSTGGAVIRGAISVASV